MLTTVANIFYWREDPLQVDNGFSIDPFCRSSLVEYLQWVTYKKGYLYLFVDRRTPPDGSPYMGFLLIICVKNIRDGRLKSFKNTIHIPSEDLPTNNLVNICY